MNAMERKQGRKLESTGDEVAILNKVVKEGSLKRWHWSQIWKSEKVSRTVIWGQRVLPVEGIASASH